MPTRQAARSSRCTCPLPRWIRLRWRGSWRNTRPATSTPIALRGSRLSFSQPNATEGGWQIDSPSDIRSKSMLWGIIAVLVVLWLLGFTVFHLGAIVHALLVIAVVVFVFNLLSGRKTV